MQLEEQQLDRLGTYFAHFHIYERFGLTFEAYVERYAKDASTCSIESLSRDEQLKKMRLRLIANKKAATIAVVTA